MTAALSSDDEAALEQASPSAVPDLLADLAEHVRSGLWLDPANPFRRNPTVEIGTGVDLRDVTRREYLAQYVAASAPLHLFDGWRYAGLALYALLYGANDNARHLAYYAELRAAMSLLATQGIGLFDQVHVVVDSNGSAIHMPARRGTHQAIWLYLQYWAGQRAATDLVGDLLQLSAFPIVEWFSCLPRLGSWMPVGTELLLAVGLDLERMTRDQRDRNEASYRPSGFSGIQQPSTIPDLEFAMSLIQTLEPELGTRPFGKLDQYLCRRILSAARSNAVVEDDDEPLQLETAFDELVVSIDQQQYLKDFLTRSGDDASDPPIIKHALQNETHDHPDYPYHILSRSVLLLRISTGSVKQLLSQSGLPFGHLDAWLENIGETHGLWGKSVNGSEGLADLWLDFREALNVLKGWSGSEGTTRHSLFSQCAREVVDVTGMTRFGLMGIAQ